MADWTAPTQARVEGYFKEINNWGRWGDGDQLGTVNLITAAKREAATKLVRTGRTVSLARIPFLGLALVDNTDPDRLAVACREEGRYEFLFTATPIRLVGSTGAPAHPMAMF